jgi:L-asparaginase II
MSNIEPNYAKLVEYQRNGLVEQLHFGIILHLNKQGIINKIGDDNNYKFYHRSCMKPMQASPLIDLGLDKKYNLSLEEIAVCCASHTGSVVHQKIINQILSKIGFSEDDLLCLPHAPLSLEEQKRLFQNNLEPTKIHNNCSGKHSIMLAFCKELGFPIKNYKDFDNQLSDFIINHVCKLCEVDRKNVVVSKDGCGLPVIATSLEELGRGFLNLFCNQKYYKIQQAFLNFPYVIGGNNRLDTQIISSSKNLVAKVGACGLCVVVNIEKEECVVVKIADSNMEAREVATIDFLEQLKWPISIENDHFNKYTKVIKSQDDEILGEIHTCFNIV